MAVKIRLKRMGKIRQPHYRVVVVDGRKKRDGKVIEEIGKYHPKQEPSFIEVTSDRAQYWLGVGAQPSEAVEAILKITGDWQKFKGLPGTEGTLRVAEPKRDKTELFNEALKDSANEPKAGATTRKKTAARMLVRPGPCFAVRSTANETARRPNRVVNLMIGFSATLLVSLNGSPTVSPTTQASCSGVPLARSSVSTTFFALSQAPPALAMKMA